MKEQSPVPRDNEQRWITCTNQVGRRALTLVEQNYGRGYPAPASGRRPLAYHNRRHGVSTGDISYTLCEPLDLVERTIARTAGYGHDLVQLKGRGIDEGESAEWLERELRRQGIPDAYTHMGALAILGTQPLFDASGKITGQTATRQTYPSKAAEHMALSVASADLGELYSPHGPLMGHLYGMELNENRKRGTPEITPLGFQAGQLRLVESYRYPLPSAEKTLTTHKRQVIKYTNSLMKELEQGTVATWNEVLERDIAFLKKHG